MKPQRLAAVQGWQWIKQGYALFMKAPLLWIVVVLICLIAMTGLSKVPMVGEPLASLLLPAVLVGLMAGCRSLERGDELELAHLFSGFQQRTTQLVTLGGIALVGQFLIFGVMMMVGGATLVSILMSGQPVEDPEVIKQAVSGAGFAMLLGLTLFSVLVMAMQFAPMLVFFNNAAPLKAMKLSLNACLKNLLPLSVYSGILFLIFLASSPIIFIPMFAIFGDAAAYFIWIFFLPIVIPSIYAAYSGIFPAPKESQPPAKSDDIFIQDKGAF